MAVVKNSRTKAAKLLGVSRALVAGSKPNKKDSLFLNILVSEPYLLCPKCKENFFGVLTIHDQFYNRRCAKCGYPSNKEKAAFYPLPEVSKKVIYLDQFMISNMVKALSAPTEPDNDFYLEAFKKLDRLSKLQLIVCPDSEFHEDESIFSKFPKEHKRVYELLSHGISYSDEWTVLRFQVLEHLENWIEGGVKADTAYTVDKFVSGKINVWQQRLILAVESNRVELAKGDIKKAKDGSHEHLQKVYAYWESEKGKKWDHWYKKELEQWKWTISDSFKTHIRKAAEVYAGINPNPLVILPTPLAQIFIDIAKQIRKKWPLEEDYQKKLNEFLNPDSLVNVPFIRIYCQILASVAHRISCGNMKKENIKDSFFTDVFISSTILPFCDAIFLEKQIAGFMREKPLSLVISKMPMVFSMSNKDEFLKYLDEIEKSAPPEHLAAVAEVYGKGWGQPYSTVLNDFKKKAEHVTKTDQ